MQSNGLPSEYHGSNKRRTVNRNNGVVISKTRNGSYNIVEKDFGDRKVIYHIPIEYGDDYDTSLLDDMPAEENIQLENPSKLVRRQIYHQYDQVNGEGEHEYTEEIPIIKSHRNVYIQPQVHNDTDIVEEFYEVEPPTQPRRIVKYIYDDDNPTDIYDYRPQNTEVVEYLVRERVPQQTYVEEFEAPLQSSRSIPAVSQLSHHSFRQPISQQVTYREPSPHEITYREPSPHEITYREPSPRDIRYRNPSPREPPSPQTTTYRDPSPHDRVSRQPRQHEPSPRERSVPQASFPKPASRTYVTLKLPSPPPSKTSRHNKETPPPSTRRTQPVRAPPLHDPPVRPNIPKATEPPLRLMDVIAQNRAKRGAHVRKPRREVYEEQVYDPPTYNRNIIKNGFVVHK